MKKIFTIICSAVFMCGVFQNMAKADCKLISCGDIDPFNASVPADVGGNQCWFCGLGPNSCNNYDVVPFMDSVGDVIKLRQCSIGWESWTFLEYAPAIFCKDSPLHPDKGNVDTTNAKVTYRLTGSATKPTNLGDWNVFTGSASCKYVKCNTGYLPNADKTACVADSRESNCSASGGTWTGSACQCDSNKGLKQNSGNTACVCKKSGYKYVDTSQKCEESEESKKLRDQKKNEQVKNKCIGSGGTWNPTSRSCNCSASKNLIRSGEVCVCKSAEYTKSSDEKSCVLTDVAARKRECENVAATNSDVYWDESAKECKCRDIKKEFVSGKCEIKEAITKCNSVTGAKWSDYNEECVCVDDNMKIDSTGTKCVEKEYVKQEREQQAIAGKIISAGGELDSIVAGFGKSKWKNAQGEFNTARLASDSIAAVVLGTAGGLITSSVMKKHQVEDGFEDLKCVIGGQPVAGWGDEFRVGIQ